MVESMTILVTKSQMPKMASRYLIRATVIVAILSSAGSSLAGSSLLGPQGLLLTPTANLPVDRQFQVGVRQLQAPYAFIKGEKVANNFLFYASLVYLPRLEVTLSFTTAPGRHGNDGSNVYKDAAVFAQFFVLEEKDDLPALAIGMYDFYSYSFYNALFMVLSKTFRNRLPVPLQAHLGYGVDWIDKHYGDTGPDRDVPVPHHLLGFFGGIEMALSNQINLIFEYDTDRFNTGLRFNVFEHFEILGSLLNLDTFSGGLSYKLQI